MIRITCPHCSKSMGAPDESAGKNVRCPGCKKAVPVPAMGVALPPAELIAAPPPIPPPSIPQPQFYAPQPQQPVVFVQTSHRPEPRLHSGGWFARSFMSTSGILFAIFAFFSGVVLLTCGGCLYVAYSGAAAVSEVAKQVEVEQNKIREQNKQKVIGTTGTGSRSNATASAPGEVPIASEGLPPAATSAKSAPPKNSEYASRASVLKIGNVQAKILSVSIANVPLKGIGEDTESAEKHFVVKVSLRNISTNKRIIFRGWPGRVFSNVTAKDEHDNTYRAIDFGFASKPIGDASGETIEPGGEVTSIVAFEQPIDAAQSILITLKGEALGLDDSALKWKVERTDWTP